MCLKHELIVSFYVCFVWKMIRDSFGWVSNEEPEFHSVLKPSSIMNVYLCTASKVSTGNWNDVFGRLLNVGALYCISVCKTPGLGSAPMASWKGRASHLANKRPTCIIPGLWCCCVQWILMSHRACVGSPHSSAQLWAVFFSVFSLYVSYSGGWMWNQSTPSFLDLKATVPSWQCNGSVR